MDNKSSEEIFKMMSESKPKIFIIDHFELLTHHTISESEMVEIKKIDDFVSKLINIKNEKTGN